MNPRRGCHSDDHCPTSAIHRSPQRLGCQHSSPPRISRTPFTRQCPNFALEISCKPKKSSQALAPTHSASPRPDTPVLNQTRSADARPTIALATAPHHRPKACNGSNAGCIRQAWQRAHQAARQRLLVQRRLPQGTGPRPKHRAVGLPENSARVAGDTVRRQYHNDQPSGCGSAASANFNHWAIFAVALTSTTSFSRRVAAGYSRNPTDPSSRKASSASPWMIHQKAGVRVCVRHPESYGGITTRVVYGEFRIA